ncbi:hypothetical protein BJV82DRAFT_126655 [Fennellomyces sp. T-0311]|nr:hypothetical protein BJV82DRAFT_126655 [Fennellomyces sp. T-0311]
MSDKKPTIRRISRKLLKFFHRPTLRRHQKSDAPSSPSTPSPPPRRLTDRVLGLHNKIWRRKSTQDQQVVCGCGRPLETGWECAYCRFTCPTCHRALGEGEQCSRCQVADSPLPTSTIAN